MPSPVGHALAGAAIAWSLSGPSDPGPARARPLILNSQSSILNFSSASSGLALLCAGLGAAADLDLLVPYTHRTVTHSLVAVAAVAIIAIVVTGQVTGRVAWRVVLACAGAYASHLLLDWLAVDDTPPRGLQILWPFSDRWFISGLDLFRGTARRDLFSAASMRENVLAVVQEIATLGPVALAAWLVRVKAAAGLAAQVTGGHHPAE